jgi:hypothetical protein
MLNVGAQPRLTGKEDARGVLRLVETRTTTVTTVTTVMIAIVK